MDGGAAVGRGDLVVIGFGKPVVRGDGAGIGKDQSAHGVSDRGVLLHAPVVDLEIVVDQLLVVQESGIDVADLLALSAVQDVGLRDICIAGLGQHLLDAVLDVLDRDLSVDDLCLEIGGHVERKQFDDARMIVFLKCLKCLGDRRGDLADIEFRDLTVSLNDLIHIKIPPL